MDNCCVTCNNKYGKLQSKNNYRCLLALNLHLNKSYFMKIGQELLEKGSPKDEEAFKILYKIWFANIIINNKYHLSVSI